MLKEPKVLKEHQQEHKVLQVLREQQELRVLRVPIQEPKVLKDSKEL